MLEWRPSESESQKQWTSFRTGPQMSDQTATQEFGLSLREQATAGAFANSPDALECEQRRAEKTFCIVCVAVDFAIAYLVPIIAQDKQFMP